MRNVEKSRSKLIQELAHDLRTPVASLKSLIETLNLKGKSLSVETHKEFLELSLKEVNYFERLVEDLLFLAQVTEPKYQMQKESVILASIIEDEAEDVAFRINQNQQKIELNLDLEEIKDEAIFGDIHLLRRLFRNALENSFSFAKSKVRISAQYDKTKSLFDIKIEDDGPGFSQESLLSFGERRVTRKLSQDINGRLSVGLGSVIMKAISDVHRGEIKVRNIISPNKEIAGSSLEVILPA